MFIWVRIWSLYRTGRPQFTSGPYTEPQDPSSHLVPVQSRQTPVRIWSLYRAAGPRFTSGPCTEPADPGSHLVPIQNRKTPVHIWSLYRAGRPQFASGPYTEPADPSSHLVPIQSWQTPVRIWSLYSAGRPQFTSSHRVYFRSILILYFYLILGLPSDPSNFSDHNFACISHLFHVCYIPCLSHPRFAHPDNRYLLTPSGYSLLYQVSRKHKRTATCRSHWQNTMYVLWLCCRQMACKRSFLYAIIYRAIS
jgi:hypothetical protein